LFDRIAQLQKQLARRVKGSKRWERTRLRIAKLHNRLADMRLDFLHKLSTKLTSENQVVCLEDLNVSGMLKNRKLSKAISRQGWGYASSPRLTELCCTFGGNLHQATSSRLALCYNELRGKMKTKSFFCLKMGSRPNKGACQNYPKLWGRLRLWKFRWRSGRLQAYC
jgi:hypothetical protein